MKKSIMWAQKGDWPFYGATYSASNPPRAVRVRYWLRDALPAAGGTTNGDNGSHPDDEAGSVELSVTDASGAAVRTLEGPGTSGVHEVLWDWRHDAPYDATARGGGGGGRGGGTPRGPVVVPGTYTVSMSVGGETYSAEVEIEADPRRPMTTADRQERQDVLMSLHALAKPLYDASERTGTLSDQMDGITTHTSKTVVTHGMHPSASMKATLQILSPIIP